MDDKIATVSNEQKVEPKINFCPNVVEEEEKKGVKDFDDSSSEMAAAEISKRIRLKSKK